MTELPTGPRGKAVALGLCFLVLAALYLVVISPLLGFYGSNAQKLQDRLELVQRLQRAAHALPELQAMAQDKQGQAVDANILLEGTSDTVAAAMLQTTMKGLVEGAGARLASAEILGAEKRDNFQRIGIHVSFTGDLAVLTSVLRGIQLSHPVIFVDNVDIHGAAGAGDDAGAGKLAIALDLYGFRPL